jgi:hypothetical protein
MDSMPTRTPTCFTSSSAIRVAATSAKIAVNRKANLFRPYPHVSLEDVTQEAIIGILNACYDITQSEFATFCYMVASRRALDYLDKLKCRGVAESMGNSDPVASDRQRRSPGRPNRWSNAVKAECMVRRMSGESLGSISMRYKGLSRWTILRWEKNLSHNSDS